ncbi:MAG: TolC family protein [Planctomycetota bacterium]
MFKPPALSLAALLCAVSAGCATYEPVPLVPADELAALVYRAATDPAAPELRRGDLPDTWFPLAPQVQFDDGLSLAEVNALALQYSSAVVLARTAVGEAEAEALGAGVLPNPELYVGARVSTAGAGVVVPLTLSWRLPLGGRLDAEEKLADAVTREARWRLLATELETLGEVRRRLIDLDALHTRLAILTEAKGRVGEVVGWVNTLAAAGTVDPVTSGLARLHLAESEARIADASLSIDGAESDLKAALGLLPSADVRFLADADRARLTPSLPPPDPASVLLHPRTKALEVAYQGAEQALRGEVAKQVPDLQIGPDLEGSRGDIELGLGVAISIPITDRNQGAIAAARVRRDRARETYRTELITLRGAEAKARAEASAAAGGLARHQEITAPLVDATVVSLTARLRAGRAEVFEVLQALDAIADARLREVDLRARSASAHVAAAVHGAFDLAPAQDSTLHEGTN